MVHGAPSCKEPKDSITRNNETVVYSHNGDFPINNTEGEKCIIVKTSRIATQQNVKQLTRKGH